MFNNLLWLSRVKYERSEERASKINLIYRCFLKKSHYFQANPVTFFFFFFLSLASISKCFINIFCLGQKHQKLTHNTRRRVCERQKMKQIRNYGQIQKQHKDMKWGKQVSLTIFCWYYLIVINAIGQAFLFWIRFLYLTLPCKIPAYDSCQVFSSLSNAATISYQVIVLISRYWNNMGQRVLPCFFVRHLSQRLKKSLLQRLLNMSLS